MEGLKYRHEEKYMINKNDYLSLKNRLSKILNHDNNASGGEYQIRSLYFDDMQNTALYEKLAGISDRKKYRIRIYNNSDKYIVLEKKIKNQEYTAKKRQEISKEEYNNIISSNTTALLKSNKPLLRDLAIQMMNRILKPIIVVEYLREAYVSYPGNVRITFDKYLKTGLNKTKLLEEDMPMVKALEQGQFIMEIKYDEFLPSHIKSLIQVDGRWKQSISKYTLCRKYIKKNSWEDQ
ncbi:MAG: polyphosphate polymerase domain-containing protein [Firmicutes bacterium]|nr:polyphosphate polymerase domain-containing protein [Bacillota bacterium]